MNGRNELRGLIQKMQSAIRAVENTELWTVADGHRVRPAESLQALAKAYAAACAELNRRVYRCAELLERGLRNEALKLARRPPSIQDALYLLDLPELPAWLRLCQSYPLELPPLLDRDTANTVIDELHEEDGALEVVLRAHRRMAIGRAPLADRIRILRHIVRQDPSPGWTDDLKAYERARLQEMAEVVDCLHSRKPERRKEGCLLIQVFNVGDAGRLEMEDAREVRGGGTDSSRRD